MAETSNAKKSSFIPGKKYIFLGISLQTTNPWVRWGLPIAVGLAIGLIFWLLS